MTTLSAYKQVQATRLRQQVAYKIVKRMAMDSGFMAHERDTLGFMAWCMEFEMLNAPDDSPPPWESGLRLPIPPEENEDD